MQFNTSFLLLIRNKKSFNTKNFVWNVDSDEYDKGINDAVPVASVTEMQKMIKNMRSYLDANLNG